MIETSRKGEWLEIIVPEKWTNYSVQEIFRTFWQAPKKLTHSLRMEKGVKVNGQPADWTAALNLNDRLAIRFFSEQEFGIQPSYHELSILYEDDHLIVVNKPAKMDTHPNVPEETDTLSNAVAYHLLSNAEYRQVKHVHRLDRDTTGAVLFAKHPFIGSILDQMLEKREIKRTYLALVQGIITAKKGTIKEPIGRDRHHATRRRVSPSGQRAVTHFEVLQTNKKQNLTLVKCFLETGRTHQIRVHFSHIGFPLAGDLLYGGKPIFSRQALHAIKLEFVHPITEETITCHAPFLDTQNIFTGIDPYSI
ncbi:RluA family pseudouridine synthase [Niallia endozanthoxylica]|uniref:Pseudouridine synthase n=1 Tax=Niallia endozanthoxylica TaxID=2036016 RepID=A0A5J5IAD7_9BACI|nr:RluA family pseudouridine synthase [Niallia endozanthoxylica]KAA9031611.1 RluA family pseudouridine synthase [Niallia endozanthoxylica]